MLNHLVLLKVSDEAPAQEVDRVLEDLRGLSAEVDGVLELCVGPDVSIEGLAHGYTHGLLVRFADEAARQRYLQHRSHRAIGERLQAHLDGVAIVDIAAA